ncbi:MAG: hypothetical protein N2448_10945 [Caloramator sp.]|nr:hypothetical protein [Caloramator sp.]
MKKILSLITVLALALGILFPAFTASAVTYKEVESNLKTGIITAFTQNSVTIIESGKKYVLPFAKNIKILKQGEMANIMDAAYKGAKVQYKVMLKKNVPVSVSYLDIPPSGSIYDGNIGTSFSNKQITTFSYKETPNTTITLNPSRLLDVNSLTLVKEFVSDYDSYVIQGDGTEIFLGNYSLVQDSVKLTVAGKEIKIISDKAEFDKKDATDEAKLLKNSKGEYILTLETPLTKEQIEKSDEVVKVVYKVNELNMERTEILNLLVNEDVYCELNGKEVSFSKAMYRGNYASAYTNEKGEIVYINAYYRDLLCIVNSISGNKISISAIKNGYIAFNDILTINEGCNVTDVKGEEISLSNLKQGDKILITNAPDLNYQVISISKIE